MAEQQEYLGQQVGKYRLLQQIGRGSFGTVYLAKHLNDHSQAAIKLLRLYLTKNEDFRDFVNEARSIRLRHPHIVPLLDFGLTPNNTPYLVMEYAAGGTLRQRHPKGNKLSLDTIDTYVTQLASALQYAHDHSVIHRDVKPENVLLQADGTILLSDFGIAKVLEQSSFVSLQTQVGTPAYMAPEQSRGKPCPASDQYALGVIVYEWLAGRLPFQGAPLEVMLQHRADEPPSLQNLCPEIPIQVEQVILQALAKTPEERFNDVEQFGQALRTALRASSPTALLTPLADQPTAVPPILPSSFPLQTIWPTDRTVAPEPLSGFPHLSEMSSAPSDKMSTSLPLQLAHSVKTQTTLDSQQVRLPLQPSSAGNQPAPTQGPSAFYSQSAPVHTVTVNLPSRNKRFTRRILVGTLLCLILLISLAGAVLSQQHVQNLRTGPQNPQLTITRTQTASFVTATAINIATTPTQTNINNNQLTQTAPTQTNINNNQPTQTAPIPTSTSTPTREPAATPTPTPQPPQEVLTVPFVNGTSGVQTVHSYSGKTTITVTGTGQASGTQMSDAFYLYTDSSRNPITPVHPTEHYNWTLWINSGPADNFVQPIPPYNSSHKYTFTINAPGGTLNFAVGDTATADNTGSYTVTITQS